MSEQETKNIKTMPTCRNPETEEKVAVELIASLSTRQEADREMGDGCCAQRPDPG